MKYRQTDEYPLGSHSTTLWLGLLLLSAFSPVALFAPRQEAFEIVNAMLASTAAGIAVGYGPSAWSGLKKPITQLESGDALNIGIALSWSANAIMFGLLFWWRLTGKDSAVVDSAFNLYSRWTLITASFLHLSASGSVDGIVPLRAHLRAGLWTALGLAMGALVIAWAAPGVTRL